MTDEKHLIDVFVPFFEKHLPQLHQTYCWPVSEKAKSALPHFQWHPKSGSLEECIALKHHLTQTWASATPADKAAVKGRGQLFKNPLGRRLYPICHLRCTGCRLPECRSIGDGQSTSNVFPLRPRPQHHYSGQ